MQGVPKHTDTVKQREGNQRPTGRGDRLWGGRGRWRSVSGPYRRGGKSIFLALRLPGADVLQPVDLTLWACTVFCRSGS
eukprot:5049441-Alexandrium_andersonii.AAC.1